MGLFTPNIRKLAKKDDVPALLKCLSHRRPEVRYGAFAALAGRERDEEVMRKLRVMVDDPDPWVKTIAVLKFAELGDPSIAENLVEIITDGSREARIALLDIIAGRGPSEDRSIIEVIRFALADKKEIIRRHAIIAAGASRSRRLVPFLADRLREKHHDIRIHAAKAMYLIGGEESADYLIGLLADNDSVVRDEARACLATMEYEHARKALGDARFMELIKGMNDKEPVRRRTAQYIGDAGIREGLPLLHRACHDRYKGVRIEALRAMAAFRSPTSVDPAAKLLKDKFYDVRLEAVCTLEQIADARSLEALKSVLDDRIKAVRDRAHLAYRRIEQAQERPE